MRHFKISKYFPQSLSMQCTGSEYSPSEVLIYEKKKKTIWRLHLTIAFIVMLSLSAQQNEQLLSSHHQSLHNLYCWKYIERNLVNYVH